jgi:HAD superfamily hydrolase (TIGR01490 family)
LTSTAPSPATRPATADAKRSTSRESKKAAAFFDLDRTLMAGSSAMHFGRAAYRSGMVRRRQLAAWGIDHIRFRLRGSTDESAQAVLALVKDLLEGVPEKEIARMAPDLLAGILPRVYPLMMDEVHAHQDAGRPAFIVSAASNPLVELLAHVLGFEGGIGTRYEVAPDGTLTGDIEGPFIYGEGKVEAMRRFADAHGIELESSWAYSDSGSDLPMLRAVGNPVAVNPDPELAEVARSEGWRVMRFEKLGRRLAIAGATLAAAAVGGSGTWLAARRRAARPSRLRPPVPGRR